MNSLITNANLVLKVYLPRAALVVATVLAVCVTFLVELSVLAVVLLGFGANSLLWLPLVVVFVVLLTAFTLGLALMFSIANVYFRDTQHFMTIFIQVWFYLTPILYPLSYIQAEQDRLAASGRDIPLVTIFKLNPMEHFVSAFRNLLYDNRLPTASDLAVCALSAVVAVALGVYVFGRYEGRLAEEL
jgi:ABC-2 type transport system permease protein